VSSPALAWSSGFRPADEYRPREPEHTVLHRVVAEHLETFLSEARGRDIDGQGVPDFVENEFRRFLGCGSLSGGFARLKCEKCGHEKLVPFSCKRRGICPSCTGRRMAERAAHLVDRVFPQAPVRQWVLSLPFALRYRMAWDHGLTRAVLGVFWRALERYNRKRAKERGIPGARSGAVTVIQRAGGALNLNPHFHMAVLDGVFIEKDGEVVFHKLPAPKTEEVADLVRHIRKGVLRLLGRRNISLGRDGDDFEDPLTEENPALASVSAASVYGLTAIGSRAGCRLRRLGEEPEAAVEPPKRKRHARYRGFDLHAGAPVKADERDRLERLLRYLLRPAVAESRLRLLADGTVLLKTKSKWDDGTTHLVLEPLELLEKLAAIIPRPQINLVIYHGVLGPNSKWRARVVVYGKPAVEADSAGAEPGEPKPGGYEWAELMRRTFGFDVLACPKCGGRLKLIAMIEQPEVIEKILSHLGLPTEGPRPLPARAPPEEPEQLDLPEQDDDT
jgi:hypothetical protein